MIRASFVIVLSALLLWLAPFSVYSYAQGEPTPESDTGTQTDTQIPTTIEDLKRAIILRDKIIRDLFIRMYKLEKKVEGAEDTQEPLLDASQAGEPALGDLQQPANAEAEASTQEAPELSNEERKEQERLVRAAFERTLIERGGLLLPWRKIEIEPSATFIHSSIDRIVIDGFTIENTVTIGDIFSERVRRDVWFFNGTLRMGLPWDTQAEIVVPYTLRSRNVLTASNEERSEDEAGIGDVQISLSHQFLRSKGWVPDILGSLRWKTRTGSDPFRAGGQDRLSLGSGFHSLQGTVTAVKVNDPVVFLGSLSYTETFEDSKSLGTVNPGNTYGLQLGMAMALNLDTSINFGFEGFKTEKTTVNNMDVPGSSLTTATFTFGVSYVMRKNISMDFSVGVGLTEDSPDFQVNLSVPIRFSY